MGSQRVGHDWAIKHAATAKSLQSCPTLQPQRQEPTRLPSPWDSPGKNIGVGCHFLLQWMKVKSESEGAQSYPTLRDPHGLQPSRLLCSWDFTGKSTGVGWHCLLWNEDLALPKLKEKNKFSQRNQWGLRGSRTCKMMKPVWVWIMQVMEREATACFHRKLGI